MWREQIILDDKVAHAHPGVGQGFRRARVETRGGHGGRNAQDFGAGGKESGFA